MSNPFDSKTLKSLSVDGKTYKYYSLKDLNDNRLGKLNASD